MVPRPEAFARSGFSVRFSMRAAPRCTPKSVASWGNYPAAKVPSGDLETLSVREVGGPAAASCRTGFSSSVQGLTVAAQDAGDLEESGAGTGRQARAAQFPRRLFSLSWSDLTSGEVYCRGALQTGAWRSGSARGAQMPPPTDRLLEPSQVLPPLSRFAGFRTLI